jgi:hypothetical protein
MVGVRRHGADTRRASSALRIQLVGANEHPRIEGRDQLRGRVNYLIGNDRKKWHSDVPIFDSVVYRNVYRGVDLSYYGSNDEIEYDITAAPGADVDGIKFAIEGADADLDGAGNVALKTGTGTLTLLKPVVYQEDAHGGRTNVAGEFRLGPETTSADGVAAREVTLALGAYDKSRTLVIDPQLVYSSMIGGTGTSSGPNLAYGNFNVFPDTIGGVVLADASLGVATDSSGNGYIAGTSYSNNFPATMGAYQTTLKGNLQPPPAPQDQQNPNAIIAKFNPNLSGANSLIYATYLGGAGDTTAADAGKGNGDLANGIVVDAAADAYVVGYTFSSDFPVPSCGSWGSAKNGPATVDNGFVSVLNPSGNDLIYSCFINGSAGAAATRVALNPSASCSNSSNCNVYIAGATPTLNNMGTDFPATSNAFQTTNPDTNRNAAAFFLVVNAGGGSPLYSTFYGGSGIGPQPSPDAVQFGGEGALAVTVDSAGNGYMTGYTFSIDLPLSANPAQSKNNAAGVGLINAFVVAFNPNASGSASLLYSTYFGGSGVPFSMGPPTVLAQGDVGTGIAVDGSGHIFIIGSAYSTNLTTTSNAYQTKNGGATNGADNAFITEFDITKVPASQIIYSTYFGGAGQQQSVLNSIGEFPAGLALDSSDRVFFAGTTASLNLPQSSNACQPFIQNKLISPFATILDPSQSGNAQLVFSTYLGGTSNKGDVAGDVRTFNGLIYVTGFASSNDFPSTDNAFQRPNNAFANGFTNAFVSVIDPTSTVCPTPTASATATPTPSATPTVLPGPTGFSAPRNVKLNGAPGSTVNATFSAVNRTGVSETLNSITISLGKPQIFSGITMTTGSQSVTVTSPGISSVFTFNPPIALANNATANFTLAMTLATNSAMNGPPAGVAYASILPAAKSSTGRGVLPLLASMLLLGVGLTVWPSNKRARIALAALVVVMTAATLGGCSGGGGGGGGGGASSSGSSRVFVATAVATGNGGALSNVPLQVATVVRQ